MKTFICPVMLFLVLCVSAAAADICVLDYGARGNGTFDNTAAFQAALDAAAEKGDIVRVPAGQYRINGVIDIPSDVTLEGVCSDYHFPNGTKGSVLMAYAGRDDEDSAPFITINMNGTLRGVTIIYPEQKATDIRPYPWTIRVKDKSNILDTGIANAYNGIDCGTFSNGGTCIRNLYMCALRRGIYIDRASDIGRYENIQIMLWAWIRIGEPWAPDAEGRRAFMQYVMANLEGFIIGRTDWAYMTNCFVLRPHIGFHFIETPVRPEEDQTYTINQSNILITQSGSDLGKVAVLIDKVQEHAGISFENCQFMNGISIGEENSGPVKFTGCGFWGETNTGPLGGSVIVNKGSGTVMLTACHFSRWEDLRRNDVVWNPAVPLIDIAAGSLMMTGCLFKDYSDPPDYHIRLGEGAAEAVITGNMVEGDATLRIDNASRGNLRVGDNL